MKYLKTYEGYDFEMPRHEDFLEDMKPEFFDDFTSGDFSEFMSSLLIYEDIEILIPMLKFKQLISSIDSINLIETILNCGFELYDIEFEFILELASFQEKDFVILIDYTNGRENKQVIGIFTSVKKLQNRLCYDITGAISEFDIEIHDEMIDKVDRMATFKELVDYGKSITNEIYFDDYEFYYHKSEQRKDWDKIYKDYIIKKKSQEFNL